MDYIDRKYLLLLSGYLQGWTDMGKDRYNCRCPLCGDSQKSKRKRRGYFFSHEGGAVFKCHNCGVSKGLSGMLEAIAPDLDRQYRVERFTEKRDTLEMFERENTRNRFKVETSVRFANSYTPLRDLQTIAELDEFHPVRRYIENRKIPTEFIKELRLVPNLSKFIKTLKGYEETTMPTLPAIAIPFYSENKRLEYVQFRIIGKTNLRYFTASIDPGPYKLWGLDRIDWSRHVYVLEGPFDAMFVDNAISVAGASILSVRKYLQDHCRRGYTLVFDRDYTENFEIFELLCRAIDENESVILYDLKVPGKDINDLITENNWTQDQLMEYLESRKRKGMLAKLEMSNFKPPRRKGRWNGTQTA